jgi:hypothetical protein
MISETSFLTVAWRGWPRNCSTSVILLKVFMGFSF